MTKKKIKTNNKREKPIINLAIFFILSIRFKLARNMIVSGAHRTKLSLLVRASSGQINMSMKYSTLNFSLSPNRADPCRTHRAPAFHFYCHQVCNRFARVARQRFCRRVRWAPVPDYCRSLDLAW